MILPETGTACLPYCARTDSSNPARQAGSADATAETNASSTRIHCITASAKAAAVFTEKEAGQAADLTNRIFGRLTALEPTDTSDSKGSVLWKCRCECGTEINVSADSLVQGLYKSCGCVRQERQENLHETMTFVEHTCLEVLERRKSRADNTSGFRGVSKGPDNKWLVTIGMQKKRYYIGLFSDFEDAVRARLRIEEVLHDGFVEAYQTWQNQAEADKDWADENPFYFNVVNNGHDFFIDTVFGSSTVSAI